MKRRIAGSTLWLKVLFVGLVWTGMPERWAGIIAAVAVACWAVKMVRGGIREQVWMSAQEQSAMVWEDLVWSNSCWVNPETPEQGVERLAGPHKRAMERAS